VRVEGDGTKDFGSFCSPRSAFADMEKIKPMGYHLWVDENTLALFVLGKTDL